MTTPAEVNAAAVKALEGRDQFAVLVATSDGIVCLTSIFASNAVEFARVLAGTAADLLAEATGAPKPQSVFDVKIRDYKPSA